MNIIHEEEQKIINQTYVKLIEDLKRQVNSNLKTLEYKQNENGEMRWHIQYIEGDPVMVQTFFDVQCLLLENFYTRNGKLNKGIL